ncbi:stretch-activated Ca2+-permeable channel component-domain-containing protein [Diplogelasinospora grovesii]|uniref:Stretch-activated Ca2+-permeable channel component-domain-containing protein n=1 Tax=Diplogelasinospora grovesii TaxID=303347 RepID=A0AAN6NJ61_9PEZI|nr:stretch-activated Ca2+-permeable channel component-domain-containing protein [Diplogelasinospora grovesii]
MQLSPLQSRLAASVAASCFLIVLYLTLFSFPNFAVATEIPIPKQETTPVLFVDDLSDDDDLSSIGVAQDATYEPEFSLGLDRSIIGRAPAGVTALVNNVEMPMNVVAGTTQLFMFPLSEGQVSGREAAEERSSLELRGEHNTSQERDLVGEAIVEREDDTDGQSLAKRQKTAARTIYISANTCEQPQPVNGTQTTMDPPQLTLFVSTSPSNQNPGPLANSAQQVFVEFTEGAVMYNLSTNSDVYLGIHAPNVSKVFSAGTYNFRVAASTDDWFHSYNVETDADLIWVDSDSQGALLITHNLTNNADPSVEEQIMKSQPYVMFAQNQNDRSINGMMYSYCGLQNYAQIAATKNGQHTSMVQTGMTKRGPGNLPKQQFYFSGLNASANYVGILAKNGNSSGSGNGVVGGGGHVFRATNFSTKSDHGNCAIVLNLTFCDQVAYSVPSNPSYGNATQLAQFYDSYASSMYANFELVLAQIACEAPSTQRYSLVRNCTDCAAAYKNWLCSVTIPRCEDFSNDATYLQPRALSQPFPNNDTLSTDILGQFPNTTAYNSSRNPLIDSTIQPGPYKEVLPCEDLCYTLVQSCPASMGFGCPKPGQAVFNVSYGRRSAQADADGEITCNYPGSAHLFSGTIRTGGTVPWGSLSVAGLLGLLLL